MTRVAERPPSMQEAPVHDERPITVQMTRRQLVSLVLAAQRAAQEGLLRPWLPSSRFHMHRASIHCLEALRQSGDPGPEEVILARQLADAMVNPITQRNTVYAGHTWASFKHAVDQVMAGDDELASIEFGIGQESTRRLILERDDTGAVEMREMRR